MSRHTHYTIAVLSTALFISAAVPALAITATPVPATPSAVKKLAVTSPTPEENLLDKLEQIKKLKEKIATKVAQLREKDKAAIAGTVKKIGDSSITISSLKGDRTISFSDDVQVFSMSDKGKADSSRKKMQEGDFVAAIGYLDENKHNLVASYVYIQNATVKRLSGRIADIDKNNFTITVKAREGQMIVDIEKYTKTFSYDKKTDSFLKVGFSKLAVGDVVRIATTANPKDENRASALRIYSLTFGAPPTPADSKDTTPSGTLSKTITLSPKITVTPTAKPTAAKTAGTPTAKPTVKP